MPSPRNLLPERSRLREAVRRRLEGLGPIPLLAGLVAVLSGVVVFLVASTVFAYHSSNHDEGVYLLQAAMLLEGQIELFAGDLAGAFRPWFFLEDGGRLYPKYTPVPAAMYAVSMAAFGEPRVTLAAVAAGNAFLVYLLGASTFDRRVGVVAAALFSASPLALITTSTFLPYAPTTFLNLLFAVAYLRSVRDGSVPAAGLAGVAIGLAFFARPYTAVLFAAPFVLHAAFRVASALRRQGGIPGFDHEPPPGAISRHGLTAALGLLFVGVTLAYNYRLTGSPLLFPYEAFAPQDGPGFGRRRILGHSIDYTPATALRANGYVLWHFATRWFTAGPIGTALSLGGLTFAVSRWRRGSGVVSPENVPSRFERTAGGLLAALFVTVPLGNVFFWGNVNVLGTPADPTDGLVSQFGPFYHFDVLVPLSLFAAVAAVAAGRTALAARSSFRSRLSPHVATVLVVGLLVVGVLVAGAVNAAVASGPLERNAAHADKYADAYEPVERESFDDALVFVPTPYGDWQNHPFQYLRNDPGFDGPVVYALDRGPDGDFAVLDAYQDRQYYRYTYRGEWTPNPDRHVAPKLEPLEVHSGAELSAETVVGVPDRVEHARVRLETPGRTHAGYEVDDPGESIRVDWSLDGDAARLGASGSEPVVRLEETDAVVLTITLVQPEGSTLTYRQETTVRTGPDGVEVIWPPDRYVCSLVTDCGTAGTYLPDRPGAHRPGVSFETRIESDE